MDARFDLDSLPPSLHPSIAVDRTSRALYIDKGKRYDPIFLTWLTRIKARCGDQSPDIHAADPDEIVEMRERGLRPDLNEEEVDMAVRNRALSIICEAARYRTSDMHIMLRGKDAEIQIVVNDELRTFHRFNQEEAEQLVRAIYQGIATQREGSLIPFEFQNAQISGDALPPETGLTSIRICRGPSYPETEGGAFMTLRFQYGTAQVERLPTELRPLELPRQPTGKFQLPDLGFTPRSIAKLQVLMDAPSGLILFTGPTGSGKTTTIFDFLRELARVRPDLRQVTAEDPVEYPMRWAVQLTVPRGVTEEDVGTGYKEIVRVALRMAPKVIFIGEIRGPSVAEAALQAGLTGHKVLSSLHVTDPFLFVDRLELMDRTRLNRQSFCDPDSIRGVVAQRLLPVLCPCCSTRLVDAKTSLAPRIVQALGTWGPLGGVRVKGQGCKECNHRGTRGRVAVVEVVLMDDQLAHDYIRLGTSIARENYRARRDADPSMLESAILYALRGHVDPRAVESNVNLITPRQVKR